MQGPSAILRQSETSPIPQHPWAIPYVSAPAQHLEEDHGNRNSLHIVPLMNLSSQVLQLTLFPLSTQPQQEPDLDVNYLLAQRIEPIYPRP